MGGASCSVATSAAISRLRAWRSSGKSRAARTRASQALRVAWSATRPRPIPAGRSCRASRPGPRPPSTPGGLLTALRFGRTPTARLRHCAGARAAKRSVALQTVSPSIVGLMSTSSSQPWTAQPGGRDEPASRRSAAGSSDLRVALVAAHRDRELNGCVRMSQSTEEPFAVGRDGDPEPCSDCGRQQGFVARTQVCVEVQQRAHRARQAGRRCLGRRCEGSRCADGAGLRMLLGVEELAGVALVSSPRTGRRSSGSAPGHLTRGRER